MNRALLPLALIALAAGAPPRTAAAQGKPSVAERRLPARAAMRDPAARTPAPRADTVHRAFAAGAAVPGRKVDANLGRRWERAATASGLSYEEMVDAWSEIAYASYAYDALLGRAPTAEELRRHIADMRAGRSWRDLWKEVALSPERDQRYGFYAPAPLTPDEVTRLYGIPQNLVSAQGEQCFGGVGPNCDMPKEARDFAWTFPRWHDEFVLPDGTRMAFVDVGVVVGSILHDNMCLQVRPVEGHFCKNMLLSAVGDVVKTPGTPVAMEWNKAFYNVRDHRGWTATFGPYPLGATARHGWFDDLRPTAARPAKMAPVLGMLTVPVLNVPYQGPERRASARLQAPPGTKIDQTDVAYCRSKAFSATSNPPLFAPEGTCR